jgi:two-component system, LytTR family, sensor kinase
VPQSFRWRPRTLLLLIIGASVCGVIEALQLYTGSLTAGYTITFGRSLSATLPSWYVHALLVPPTWWVAARFPLEPDRWVRSLGALVPLGVLYSAVSIVIAAALSDLVFARGVVTVPFSQHVTRLLTIYFMVTTVYFWATIGAYYLIEYRRRMQEHRRAADVLALRASRLEASLAHASLAALRLQLNPHFLFNTLNTISVLSLKGDRESVARMISRLSELLRMSLDNSRQIVTVAEEVSMLGCYLDIEQMRFGGRLTARQVISPETLEAAVPSMLLQPLVENAVRHGISRKSGPGTIEVRITTEGDRLLVQVYDTGPGFSPRPTPGGSGVGLANTRARLEQLYGADHSLLVHSPAGGGAIVRVSIPYQLQEPRENGRKGSLTDAHTNADR